MRHLAASLLALALAAGCASSGPTGAGGSPSFPATTTPAVSSATPTATTVPPTLPAIGSPIPTRDPSAPSPQPRAFESPSAWITMPIEPAMVGAAFQAVAFGARGLLATGYATTTDNPTLLAWTTRDPFSWAPTVVGAWPHGASPESALAVPGGWVITGTVLTADDAYHAIWVSSEAETWTEVPIAGAIGFAHPSLAGDRLVGFGPQEPIGGSPWVARSTADLVRWTTSPLTATGYAYVDGALTRPDGSVLAWAHATHEPMDVGSLQMATTLFLTSPDGRTWEVAPGGDAFTNRAPTAVAYGGPGSYAALGCGWDSDDLDADRHLEAWHSSDGTKWSRSRVVGSFEACETVRVIGNGAGWAAIAELDGGQSAIVADSPDGRTWTVRPEPGGFGGWVAGVTPWGDGFVAVGASVGPDRQPRDAMAWTTAPGD